MPYATLVPCPGCSRHVRARDARCPFCDAALPEQTRDLVHPMPTQRLGRAAFMAFGATLGLAACHRSPTTETPISTVVQPYGAPPNPPVPVATDSSTHAASPPPEAVVAAYGAPYGWPDASPSRDAAPADAAHAAAHDHVVHHHAVHHGGPDDPGSSSADYGLPGTGLGL
jgi:hypothetical protein